VIKKIEDYFLRKQTNRNLSERDFSQRNTPLKYLGYLIDESLFDEFEMLNEFGVGLGIQRKNIKQFTFVETRKKIPTLRHNQITNKEFNWRGEIHSNDAREFLDHPFDVLVAVYKGKHKYLDAMVAESRAKFKIGFNNADSRLFDLLISVDLKDTSLFKSEIRKYLKVMRKI